MYKTSEELQKALKSDGRQFDFEKEEFSVCDEEKCYTFEKAFHVAKKVYAKNGYVIIKHRTDSGAFGICEIGEQGFWSI